MSLCGSAASYFFSTDRDRGRRLRDGLPLLPIISFCGFGGRIKGATDRFVAAPLGLFGAVLIIFVCHSSVPRTNNLCQFAGMPL